MGVYRDRILPRVIDLMMNTKQTRQIRARVCSELKGEVVEIGFGTGHNRLTCRARRPSSALSSRRTGRPVDSARGPFGRRGVVHVEPVHHPGRGRGRPRDASRAATRRDVALRRARPGSAGEGASLAEPAQRNSAARRWRLQPQPRHPGDHRKWRAHAHPARHVLRPRRAQAVRFDVRRRRHPSVGKLSMDAWPDDRFAAVTGEQRRGSPGMPASGCCTRKRPTSTPATLRTGCGESLRTDAEASATRTSRPRSSSRAPCWPWSTTRRCRHKRPHHVGRRPRGQPACPGLCFDLAAAVPGRVGLQVLPGRAERPGNPTSRRPRRRSPAMSHHVHGHGTGRLRLEQRRDGKEAHRDAGDRGRDDGGPT